LLKKYSDNNDKTKEHKESAETPLTESELNALAARQIKAEIMGNKVNKVFSKINGLNKL